MKFKLYITLILLSLFSGTNAQTMSIQGGLDERSVSTKMKDGVPSSRVIFQSRLRLSYDTNMGKIPEEDIKSVVINSINIDTLYFYLGNLDNHRRIVVSADGYMPERISIDMSPKSTHIFEVFDPVVADSISMATKAPKEGQYFILKCDPADAQISVDGGVPSAITNGLATLYLPVGKHQYEVSAELYKPITNEVKIGSQRVVDSIKLQPNFGYLDVKASTQSTVKIDGITVGTTPYKSDKLKLGEHTVSVSATNYRPYQTNIIITDEGSTVSVEALLKSYLSSLSISTPTPDAEIYINEELKGQNSWSGSLTPGTYQIKASKTGYHSIVKTITVEEDMPQVLELDALAFKNGALNVNSNIIDADVAVDGQHLGKSPNMFTNIAVGVRSVTFSKEGYISLTDSVTIVEGEIADCSVIMSKITATKIFTNKTYINLGKPYGCDISTDYMAIEYEAFANTNIHIVNIPSTVTSIGARAFANCSYLTTISMTDGITTIGDKAFYNCAKLENLTFYIPNTVTSIGESALEVYPGGSMKEISVPNSVTYIGKNALGGKNSRVIIQISKSSPLYYHILYYYPKATIVEIEDTDNHTPEVKESEQTDASQIEEVKFTSKEYRELDHPDNFTIPNNYTTIATDAFSNSKLKSVIIPKGVTKIESKAFYYCLNLSSVIIPNSVISIGDEAFCNCYDMSSALIVIPDSVTTIGESAFNIWGGTSVDTIVIPNSVIEIGYNALGDKNSKINIMISKDSPIYKTIKERYKRAEIIEI